MGDILQGDNGAGGEGRGEPPALVDRQRRRHRSRGWCFTFNNATEADTTAVLDHAAVSEACYVIQEERGANGTPHLQGFLYFKNQVSFSTLRQWDQRIHWERTASVTASVRYCSDPAKRTGRIWSRGYTVTSRDLRVIDHQNLYHWQQALLDELNGEPHMRSVIWYVDIEGGCGKTALCRYLVKNVPFTMFVSTGSAKDITYQVVKSTWDPSIIVFNLPRSAEGAMSYSAIESLKDGLLFSGKYEGGVKLFPPPHVVVFANFMPDMTKLSLDRWDIRTLLNNPPRRLLPRPI